MKALYLDCISGISGDMMVGALIDLGVLPSGLEWELTKLNLGDFHMHYERAKRKDIEGVKFDIHEGATHHEHGHECCGEHGHAHAHEEGHVHHHHEHDHDPEHHHHEEEPHAGLKHTHTHAHEHGHGEHSHSHEHEHSHSHEHGHEHEHSHEHEHAHEHGGHSHEHHHHGRAHREIREMIEKSTLSEFVRKRALRIFRRIAEAEGKIHGMSPDDVHFHEVGALDSIADIVLTCAGIEALGVEKLFVSALRDGHGNVQCAHGTFPVPAPATLEILRGISLGQIDEPHEMITPTGAAIVAEFGENFGLMPEMKVLRIGYGLGTRELATRPNVLRAVLGEIA